MVTYASDPSGAERRINLYQGGGGGGGSRGGHRKHTDKTYIDDANDNRDNDSGKLENLATHLESPEDLAVDEEAEED